jgi:MarR family transcriptional regulator, organic hydroperoxide resistance regulator
MVAKKKPDSAQGMTRTQAKQSAPALPLTVSRPELLPGGTDREFRRLVHGLFGFLSLHETIRSGHARAIGLAGIEYTVLISIGHLALEGEVNVRSVAAHLYLTGAFITNVCNRLQALGLIDKRVDTKDRRRVSLSVTNEGRQRLAALAPMQRQVNDAEFGSLTRDEFQFLAGMIDRLVESGERAVALQKYLEAGEK